MEEEISLLVEQEDLKWRQRAKANWYTLGNKNIKYFHAYANQKRRRNKKYQVQDVYGHVVKEGKEIANAFSSYF